MNYIYIRICLTIMIHSIKSMTGMKEEGSNITCSISWWTSAKPFKVFRFFESLPCLLIQRMVSSIPTMNICESRTCMRSS